MLRDWVWFEEKLITNNTGNIILIWSVEWSWRNLHENSALSDNNLIFFTVWQLRLLLEDLLGWKLYLGLESIGTWGDYRDRDELRRISNLRLTFGSSWIPWYVISRKKFMYLNGPVSGISHLGYHEYFATNLDAQKTQIQNGLLDVDQSIKKCIHC